MTCLKAPRHWRIASCTIAIIAVTGCAGAHASKVRARTAKPAHGAVRRDSAAHQVPSRPEVKPLVGELMA
jgi:hypothetical protein